MQQTVSPTCDQAMSECNSGALRTEGKAADSQVMRSHLGCGGKPKRICMLSYSFYESDNRVMRYAEALTQRGDTVEVIAIRARPDLPKEEVIGGVKVFRIQDRFSKDARSKLGFLWPLLRFLVRSSWVLTRRHVASPYDLVHVHNVPDFLVFAACYPKLRGCRIILDIHDILPEFYASKFGVSQDSILVKALRLMERASAALANHVIISNDFWVEKYASRSARKEKCSVFINYVDSKIFRPAERKARRDGPIILFPGGLQWHQGVDIALKAFAKLRVRLPEARFHIYGDGNMKDALKQLAAELNLNGSVRFCPPVSIRSISAVMADADLGVVPKRADSFGNQAYSTKIMEFMSVGVPVVVSSTEIDRYYFDESVVRFFESGNADSMAEAMFEVLTQHDLRGRTVERASEFARRHSWQNRQADYLNLVDQQCLAQW